MFFFRVQSGSAEDIFAYQGHKEKEEQLYRDCLQEHICICKHGNESKYDYVKCDKPSVIADCSPPQRTNEIAVAGKKQYLYPENLILFTVIFSRKSP
jgi:hypothetical protein